MPTPTTTTSRCLYCGKGHVSFDVPLQNICWTCGICGFINHPLLDPQEAYQSSSPHFGAMVSPTVKVISLDESQKKDCAP